MKRWILLLPVLLAIILISFKGGKIYDLISGYETGQALDSLNHIVVYYNGSVGNVTERNLTKDGYNLGLK